ncbi:MAG TPA: phosphonate metabolism protein/1,5-bisphosphokinase (PRPP-forming) PhnN, partial [Stellaceae bacterium]|nr:phosphonate metabolism protein/1,5-bisphosphokinase (PRPP-forming) PhnN [Stellaceae bacterium]
LREEAAGGFALSWSAHGLHYGIRRAFLADLAAGIDVVASVSRGVVDEARRRYAPVTIIEVTASPALLAERLGARGRENAAEIAERVARAGAVAVSGPDVVRIDNSGTIAEGVARLRAALGRPEA